MKEDRALSNSIVFLKRVKDPAGGGSGFFVKEDLIVTNTHVVAGATSVSAELRDSETNCVIKKFAVEGVTAFDAKNDLAILKIAGEGTPISVGDSDSLQSGDIVQAIGYPHRKYKVTEGTVHGILHNNKWIRMKVRTSDGNSGGPVLNRNSEVIGIAATGETTYSHAIPSNILKVMLDHEQAVEPLAQWQEREQIRAYACLVQGKIKHKSNKNDETIINDLDKAIQLIPDFFLFYFIRGNMMLHLGQSKVEEDDVGVGQQHYQDAIDDYTEAIKLCPDYATSYDSRGGAKSYLGQSEGKKGNITEAQQQYQNAIDDHTEAIKLCSDYNLAYNHRADTKWHFGRSEDAVGNIEAAKELYQAALIDVNTAIELDSDVALFHHTRGQIKAALGDYSAAVENYERAQAINPDYIDVCKDLQVAKAALKQLEEGTAKD